MLGEDTPSERNMAAREIGRMGEAALEAVPALLDAIEQMKYADSLGAALGRIGPAALPSIREALQGGSTTVREQCLHALEVMGPAARDAVPRIHACLGDPDRGIRYRATMALVKVAGDDPETIRALAELAVHEDEGTRHVAARTLGELGPKAGRAIPGLIQALRFKPASQYPTDQVRALLKIGSTAVPGLVVATRSKDVLLRKVGEVEVAGGDAGWLMLPKTNDAVWITFEAGDINKPIWLGFWFNGTDTPPEGAGPDVRVLQSKAGHRVEFGDAEGEEHVRVSHAAGTVIEMDAGGNVLLVEAGGNIKLGSGALKKLVNETLLDLFNQHTHPYQNGTPVYGWAAPPATETQ
ncbi:MAG: HEAT repeat domain-containing protein, partial [Planctomycetota bacterium]